MNDSLAQRLDLDRNGREGIGGKVFLALFGLVWCSFVAALDVSMFRSFLSQVASTWFLPAPAHIVRSEATSHSDSEGGTSHGVAVEYTYSVNGSNYTGHRYTFDNMTSSDSQWAREAVDEFPAGSDRVCYYDPRNPARAVLAPGIHGSDITILMFMTPFNVVALCFFAAPVWIWRNRWRPTLIQARFADAVRSREAYAMKSYNPVATFVVLFGLMSFLGIFALVFPSGFHPSLEKVLAIWGIGFAISVWGTVYAYLKTKSGQYDLVLDYGSRSISVPAMHKRQVREMIPMADVKQFETMKVETGSGDDHKIKWQVKLVGREQPNRDVLVHEGYLESEAKRLAETLNAKLKDHP